MLNYDRPITEAEIQAKMLKLLHDRGHYARKIQNACSAGTPDILACVNGWFLAVEVKRPKGGRIAPLQELNRRQILSNGGVALMAPSLEDFAEVLKFLEANHGGCLRTAMLVTQDKASIPAALGRASMVEYGQGDRDNG